MFPDLFSRFSEIISLQTIRLPTGAGAPVARRKSNSRIVHIKRKRKEYKQTNVVVSKGEMTNLFEGAT